MVLPILQNGMTTWLKTADVANDRNCAIRINAQGTVSKKLGILARLVKFISSNYFARVQASLPQTSLTIDVGSGGVSARATGYTARKGFVMSKKIEIHTGDEQGEFHKAKGKGPNIVIAEQGYTREIMAANPNLNIQLIRTAVFRLDPSDKLFETNNVAERNEYLNKLNGANEGRVVSVTSSQLEEGVNAEAALQEMAKNPKFVGIFRKPGDPAIHVMDGGNKSKQVYPRFTQNEPHGGSNVEAWIKEHGVDYAINTVFRQSMENAEPSEVLAPAEDFAICGSGLFPVADPKVNELLGLPVPNKATGPSAPWHAGINAGVVLKAFNGAIAHYKALHEADLTKLPYKKDLEGNALTALTPEERLIHDANKKTRSEQKDATKALYGLIATAADLNAVIAKRNVRNVHAAHYIVDGDEWKASHYTGYVLTQVVQPFFANPANNTFAKKFDRKVAWILDI